jgi:hypothetical protein
LSFLQVFLFLCCHRHAYLWKTSDVWCDQSLCFLFRFLNFHVSRFYVRKALEFLFLCVSLQRVGFKCFLVGLQLI